MLAESAHTAHHGNFSRQVPESWDLQNSRISDSLGSKNSWDPRITSISRLKGRYIGSFRITWAPGAPGARRVRFLFFLEVFKGPEWSHDLPGPPGINSALINAQSRTPTSVFVNFWTFGSSVGPKFRTLFEKNDPLWPPRPKCSLENDPILILYPSAFHNNLPT